MQAKDYDGHVMDPSLSRSRQSAKEQLVLALKNKVHTAARPLCMLSVGLARMTGHNSPLQLIHAASC